MTHLTRLLELAGVKRPMNEDEWSRRNNHENETEAAGENALDGFSVDEFLDSEELQDYANDDAILTQHELMSALEVYFTNYIRRHWNSSLDMETDDLARTVFDKVRAALEARGVSVT